MPPKYQGQKYIRPIAYIITYYYYVSNMVSQATQKFTQACVHNIDSNFAGHNLNQSIRENTGLCSQFSINDVQASTSACNLQSLRARHGY